VPNVTVSVASATWSVSWACCAESRSISPRVSVRRASISSRSEIFGAFYA
jgi:hypothetical protein